MKFSWKMLGLLVLGGDHGWLLALRPEEGFR